MNLDKNLNGATFTSTDFTREETTKWLAEVGQARARKTKNLYLE